LGGVNKNRLRTSQAKWRRNHTWGRKGGKKSKLEEFVRIEWGGKFGKRRGVVRGNSRQNMTTKKAVPLGKEGGGRVTRSIGVRKDR